MTKSDLIQHTIDILEKLPDDRISYVTNYAEFILKKYEESLLQQGIEKLSSESHSFDFLKQEKDLYTVNDLKERYK